MKPRLIARNRWFRYGYWRMIGRRRSTKEYAWRFAAEIHSKGEQSYDIFLGEPEIHNPPWIVKRRDNMEIAGLVANLSPLSDARLEQFDAVMASIAPGTKHTVERVLSEGGPRGATYFAVRDAIRREIR